MFEIKADRPEALYRLSETATFRIQSLGEDGKVVSGIPCTVEISGDWGLSQSHELKTPAEVEVTLEKPGFALCQVNEAVAGVGFEEEAICPQHPEPADFDAFWEDALNEVYATPLNASLTPVEASPGTECFDLRLACPGGVQVSGYFARPKDAKPGSLPVHISYHGAGVYTAAKPLQWAEDGFLALDVNAHGIANGQPAEYYQELEKGNLDRYRTRGCTDRMTYYFRGMYQRVIQAIEFMKAQPEWDGVNLAVSGSSQGGAQALVAAALEPMVSCCVAHVPAFCLVTGVLHDQKGFHWFSHHQDGVLVDIYKEPVSEETLACLPYYESTSFARRISCPCLLSTGFIDKPCPPASVHAAFNTLPVTDKRMINNPAANHSVPAETLAEGTCEIKRRVM